MDAALLQTTTTTEAVTTPPPVLAEPFYIYNDSGSGENHYQDIALMGGNNNGDDGSVMRNINDTQNTYSGTSAIKFTYQPPGGEHWAGAAFLASPQGWYDDPGTRGVNTALYSKLTFRVKGSGGSVKFFIEGSDGSQSTQTLDLPSDWQPVTLDVKNAWDYITVGLGWACNNLDASGGTITFWIDEVRFEA